MADPYPTPGVAWGNRLGYYRGVTVAGWALMAVGFVLYLLAFAQGPGPTMGDRPLQATLFTLATLLMIGGFFLVAVV